MSFLSQPVHVISWGSVCVWGGPEDTYGLSSRVLQGTFYETSKTDFKGWLVVRKGICLNTPCCEPRISPKMCLN